MDPRKRQIREAAEASLEAFIKLVHPNRVLGHVHQEVIGWWTRDGSKSHQLLLLPRDHQKSALVAYRVAWEITRNPSVRILYISSTQNLAVKQLKFVKDILTSPIYRFYWPEMINVDEGRREKWTETEIAVDHPARKEQIVRDPTVFTAGLTTVIVGMHCDIAVLDDVVIDDTAYSPEGRNKVATQVSYLASIAGADARLWSVGTRYHPKDLYNDMMEMGVEVFDNEGYVIDTEPLYEIMERQVETGGEFLWPRKQREDGKWFGFDRSILAKKKAQYKDYTKFRAQYYNDPNDVTSANIKPAYFQYFDRSLLRQVDGKWYLKGNKLNVFASVDFAYTVNKNSDFTCIVVIGIDSHNNIFILDIDRFQTSKISDYFNSILRLHVKWGFRKIRAECTAAQSVIVEDLKTNYIRVHGLALSVVDERPTKDKASRIEATLQPRYTNMQMWHYRGGFTEELEEELVKQNPAHDDIKDALASAVEISIPPSFMGLGQHISGSSSSASNAETPFYHPRFGGVN